MDLSGYYLSGYQVIPGVFETPQLELVRQWLVEEMNKAMGEIRTVMGLRGDEDIGNAIRQFVAKGRHHEVSADLKNALAGQYPLRVRLNELLQCVLRSPRLRAVLQCIFPNQELRSHLPPMARFVLPGNSLAGVPAHQDISYNKHMSDFVTGWVPLVAVDDECGGVRIWEQTKNLVEQLESLDRDVWLAKIPDLEVPKKNIHMEPGDLLIFNPYVVHESLPNRSDRVRFSIDYRFFGSKATSFKHFLDMETGQVILPNAA